MHMNERTNENLYTVHKKLPHKTLHVHSTHTHTHTCMHSTHTHTHAGTHMHTHILTGSSMRATTGKRKLLPP